MEWNRHREFCNCIYERVVDSTFSLLFSLLELKKVRNRIKFRFQVDSGHVKIYYIQVQVKAGSLFYRNFRLACSEFFWIEIEILEMIGTTIDRRCNEVFRNGYIHLLPTTTTTTNKEISNLHSLIWQNVCSNKQSNRIFNQTIVDTSNMRSSRLIDYH